MTDEVTGNKITHFASWGPKSYAYRTQYGDIIEIPRFAK